MSRRKSSAPTARGPREDQGSNRAIDATEVLTRAAAMLSPDLADVRLIRYVRGLPHVLTEWFSDPKYLGADDRPLELPLHARGPSLAKLILRALPGDNVEQAAAALVRAKAVRQNGRLYTAISRQLNFSDDPQSTRAHSIAGLSGHIAAIQHNVACQDAGCRVLEREASNLYIPTRLLAEVHQEIRQECGPLLFAIDNLLQSKQVPPGSEPTTCVGVSVVAYEDPWTTRADERASRGTHKDSAKPTQSTSLSQESPPSRELPAGVSQVIQRFVRILSRFGVTQEELLAGASQEYGRIANDAAFRRVDSESEIPAASHVLTVWRDDPSYTEGGEPRRLKKRGTAPSFRSLVAAVDPLLDSDRVLSYLIRTGSVEQRGNFYHAINNAVILRGHDGPAIERTLRRIGLMLATTENNLQPASVTPGWIERMAENTAVPISRLGEWAAYLELHGMNFLNGANEELRRYELERPPGEPSVAAGVALYRFQENEDPPAVRRAKGTKARVLRNTKGSRGRPKAIG